MKPLLRRFTPSISRRLGWLGLCLAVVGAGGCGNNPYPRQQSGGSVLYRRLADDPKTLDPSTTYVIQEGWIVDVIYPSFFQYHYLKRNPFVLELALGAEEPTREPYPVTEQQDGKTVRKQGEAWTFRIKRGVRFQDDPCFPGGKGREVTAADFVYSFRRMADPNLSPGSPVLSFFEDKVLGLHEYAELNRERQKRKLKADFTAPVAGLQLDPRDPYTFRILLNQPYPQLRYMMAMHFTAPLAHEAVDRYGAELSRHPVGCGPYVLKEFLPKQRVVLEANPNRRLEYYPTEGMPEDRAAGYLEDAGKQLPLTDTIVYNIIRETVTGWNLFFQGYLDVWEVTQEDFQTVMGEGGELSPAMKQRNVILDVGDSPNMWYAGFNMTDPVVGGYTPEKRKLRQAISTAIDAQAFIDLFLQGSGLPAQAIVPPGVFGYEAEYRNPYRQYDLQHAKRLLAEAGYPDGIDPRTGERLRIYYDNSAQTPADQQSVGLMTKYIEALGIEVVSRSWRAAVMRDRIEKGQFQFARFSWYADYPDPENFVFLLYGPNRRPGPNGSAYDSPEYNRLFEQVRAMDDSPERLALLRKMRDVAVEDCPLVYLYHKQALGLTYGWVGSAKPHPIANDFSKYWRVDGPVRAARQTEWNRPNYWPILAALLFLIAGSVPAVAAVRGRSRRRARRS